MFWLWAELERVIRDPEGIGTQGQRSNQGDLRGGIVNAQFVRGSTTVGDVDLISEFAHCDIVRDRERTGKGAAVDNGVGGGVQYPNPIAWEVSDIEAESCASHANPVGTIKWNRSDRREVAPSQDLDLV